MEQLPGIAVDLWVKIGSKAKKQLNEGRFIQQVFVAI
jgi:hypothetical protein